MAIRQCCLMSLPFLVCCSAPAARASLPTPVLAFFLQTLLFFVLARCFCFILCNQFDPNSSSDKCFLMCSVCSPLIENFIVHSARQHLSKINLLLPARIFPSHAFFSNVFQLRNALFPSCMPSQLQATTCPFFPPALSLSLSLSPT